MMMESTIVGFGHGHIVFDFIVYLSHLYLVVHYIGCEVPICHNFLHPFRQFMEFPQRQLTKIVKIEL